MLINFSSECELPINPPATEKKTLPLFINVKTRSAARTNLIKTACLFSSSETEQQGNECILKIFKYNKEGIKAFSSFTLFCLFCFSLDAPNDFSDWSSTIYCVNTPVNPPVCLFSGHVGAIRLWAAETDLCCSEPGERRGPAAEEPTPRQSGEPGTGSKGETSLILRNDVGTTLSFFPILSFVFLQHLLPFILTFFTSHIFSKHHGSRSFSWFKV